jgi:hypothetical protein
MQRPFPANMRRGSFDPKGEEPDIKGGAHEFAAGFCPGGHIDGSDDARLGTSGGANGRDDEQRQGKRRIDSGFHRHQFTRPIYAASANPSVSAI